MQGASQRPHACKRERSLPGGPREKDFKRTLRANINGFSLHAAVRIDAGDLQALEPRCRCIRVHAAAGTARAQWRSVADHLHGRFPELGLVMDETENDAQALMNFARAQRTQIHSTTRGSA